MPQSLHTGSQKWMAHLHQFFFDNQVLPYPCKKRKSFSSKTDKYYWIEVPFIEINGEEKKSIKKKVKSNSIEAVEIMAENMIYHKLSHQLSTHQVFYTPDSSSYQGSTIKVKVGPLLLRNFKHGFYNKVSQLLLSDGVYKKIQDFLSDFEPLFSEKNLLMSDLFVEGELFAAFSIINQVEGEEIDVSLFNANKVIEIKDQNKNYLNKLKKNMACYPFLLNQLISLFDLIKMQQLNKDFIFFKKHLEGLLENFSHLGLNLNKKIPVPQAKWVEINEKNDLNQYYINDCFNVCQVSRMGCFSGRLSPRTKYHYQSLIENISSSESFKGIYKYVRQLQEFLLKYPQVNPMQHQLAILAPVVEIGSWLLGFLSLPDKEKLISTMKHIYLMDSYSDLDSICTELGLLRQSIGTIYKNLLAEQQALESEIKLYMEHMSNIKEIIEECSFWYSYKDMNNPRYLGMFYFEGCAEQLDAKLEVFSKMLDSDSIPEPGKMTESQLFLIGIIRLLHNLNLNSRYTDFKVNNMDKIFVPINFVDPIYLQALNEKINCQKKFKNTDEYRQMEEKLLALSFLSDRLEMLDVGLAGLTDIEEQTLIAASSS